MNDDDAPPPAAPPTGHVCRHCGARVDAKLTGALPFFVNEGAGRHEYAHLACYERAEEARQNARAEVSAA